MSGDFYQKILFYEIFKFYFNEKTTISDFKKFKRSLGMLFETSSKVVLLKKNLSINSSNASACNSQLIVCFHRSCESCTLKDDDVNIVLRKNTMNRMEKQYKKTEDDCTFQVTAQPSP